MDLSRIRMQEKSSGSMAYWRKARIQPGKWSFRHVFYHQVGCNWIWRAAEELLKSCWKRLCISLRFYAPFYWATETELAVKFLFGSFISMIPSPGKPSTTSAKSTIEYHIRKVFALQQSFRVGEEHFKIIQMKNFWEIRKLSKSKNDARYDPKTKRGDLQHESQ